MKKITINLFVFITLFASLLLTGCSIPGSSGTPVEDDSVTISGVVGVPQVAASGILAAIGETNSPDAFARFVASAACQVNGRAVTYSLNADTRVLTVEKLSPAAAYNVELRCNGLKLRAFAPHTGRKVSLPMGVSLRSSADWHLRDALAKDANIAHDQLNDYQVKTALLDSLAGSMQAELKKSTMTTAAFDKHVSDATTAAISGKAFSDCMQRSTTAFSYSGEYSGKVFYYLQNASGKTVAAVQAVASMTCLQSGNQVSGSVTISPTGLVPLVEKPGVQEPGKTAFAFSGTVNSYFLTFIRRGTLGPLAGKNLDSWFIMPVRGGLAVKSDNLDTAYYTGLVTRPGEFLLQKK